MRDDNFVETVKKMVAREAVGVTAMRGQAKGTLKAVHGYLDAIDLSSINVKNENDYIRWLDGHTCQLLEILPGRLKPWGAARKALNLFMRTALYNRYLNDEFKLERVEKRMEIPLDSAVAKGLKKEGSHLPQWPGLRRLTRDVSDQFQSVAQSVAARRKIATVHLDMYLWMENR